VGGIRVSYIVKFLILFFIYVIAARIGLSLDAVNGFATLVWPPTGIALAAILVWGFRFWPSIFAGALLTNLMIGAPWPVALGIATGNTLEVLLGAYLLIRFAQLDISLERLKDVVNLIFLAAITSTLASATVGTTSLLLGKVIPISSYGETWFAWWIGNMLGVIIFTPLLLVWTARIRSKLEFKRLLKAIVPFSVLIIASSFVFMYLPSMGVETFLFAHIVLPPLVWIALRFGQLGSVTAIFIAAFMVVFGAVINHGAAGSYTLSSQLIMLQSLVGVTAATFLTMASIVSEREKTQRKEEILRQKTALLAKQRARLRELNKAKDDFIAIASHQLRTPASGVKQYLGILLENYVGNLTEKQRIYAEKAYEINERQIKTINDLLQVARLDAGKLHLNKSLSDINKLISNIVEEQYREFKKRKQQITFTPGTGKIMISIDRELMHMVLENIVDNAGKYSLENGKVSLSVDQSNDRVLIKISDSGIGIAKKDQAKMFQKFSRANSENAESPNGSGLGLYWAKKIVDLHNGRIALHSELKKGSTFIISLPKSA
jgi:signal transduction histidine kinase